MVTRHTQAQSRRASDKVHLESGLSHSSITFRKAINKAGTDNYYHYNVNEGNIFKWVDDKMIDTGIRVLDLGEG